MEAGVKSQSSVVPLGNIGKKVIFTRKKMSLLKVDCDGIASRSATLSTSWLEALT